VTNPAESNETAFTVAEAEAWARGPQDWETQELMGALMAEYDRLKAIEAAVGPVIEHLARMDDEDLADIHCASPAGFAAALVALLKAAAA